MSNEIEGGFGGAGQLVQGRMGFDEREKLMMYLLRHPGVFSEAKQVLTAAHFDPAAELIWGVSWQACCDLYDQYGALPPAHALAADALSRLTEHPGAVPDSGVTELQEFLEIVFGVEGSVLTGPYQAYGFDLLQKFLRERHWADHVRRLVDDFGDNTPVHVDRVIEARQTRHAQVTGATAVAVQDLGAETTGRPLRLVSTGFAYMDRPMGGGAADGEVYGLLGTFGSGKTMQACGLLAEAGTRAVNEARGLRQYPRHSFYFTYETPVDDIRRRVWSYAGGINLNNLNDPPYSRSLSRAGNRLPYEDVEFPTDPRGEWERFEDLAHIRRVIHLADMSGPPENPKAGSGGVEEIAAELQKYQSRYGVQIDTVIIDYALVCVRRQIKARGLDPDKQLRHLLGGFGEECRRQIATKFGCKVWVLNQLSGQANKKAAGAKMSHADSAEATNFAENLWYCFWMGNKDRRSNTLAMGCSKTRRSEGSPEDSVLQLRGELARFVEADDRYMIDPYTRRIVKRTNGEMVTASDAARPRPAPAPRPNPSGGMF